MTTPAAAADPELRRGAPPIGAAASARPPARASGRPGRTRATRSRSAEPRDVAGDAAELRLAPRPVPRVESAASLGLDLLERRRHDHADVGERQGHGVLVALEHRAVDVATARRNRLANAPPPTTPRHRRGDDRPGGQQVGLLSSTSGRSRARRSRPGRPGPAARRRAVGELVGVEQRPPVRGGDRPEEQHGREHGQCGRAAPGNLRDPNPPGRRDSGCSRPLYSLRRSSIATSMLGNIAMCWIIISAWLSSTGPPTGSAIAARLGRNIAAVMSAGGRPAVAAMAHPGDHRDGHHERHAEQPRAPARPCASSPRRRRVRPAAPRAAEPSTNMPRNIATSISR